MDGASAAIGAIGGLAAIFAPIIGGAIAEGETREERRKSEEAFNKAMEHINAIGAPPDMARAILLKEFKSAGVYTPAIEEAITQSTSKVAEMQERDPSLREAQKSALSAFTELGKTGLSAEDRLALRTARQQAETANRGRIEAIKQNMAQRGIAGGGAELAAQMASAQAADEGLSMAADRQAAQAQQARLAALSQMSGLGAQMRQQDWGQDLQRAGAADELSRFNVLQRSGAQQRNIDRSNQGSLYNLGQQQRLSDMNVSQANQEALRQRQGELANWQNQAARQQMFAGAQQGASKYYSDAAARKAANIMGIASGIGQGAATIAGGAMNMAKKTPPQSTG